MMVLKVSEFLKASDQCCAMTLCSILWYNSSSDGFERGGYRAKRFCYLGAQNLFNRKEPKRKYWVTEPPAPRGSTQLLTEVNNARCEIE
jgi:hypothetical protein